KAPEKQDAKKRQPEESALTNRKKPAQRNKQASQIQRQNGKNRKALKTAKHTDKIEKTNSQTKG
ncbi:hypothetical protein, partial [Klebsiella pneumoniae]|uniref:hypothetical protein n=1 Tax=Klebsiella pneumoniae TaxID=573 RepID=UPI003B5A77C1